MKALFGLLIGIFISLPLWATTQYLSFDSSVEGDYRLEMISAGQVEEPLWIRYYNESKDILEEQAYKLAPGEKRSVSLKDYQRVSSGIIISQHENSELEIYGMIAIGNLEHVVPLSPVASNSLNLNLSGLGQGGRHLNIYNPTHVAAEIQLRSGSGEAHLLQQIRLSGHESLNVKLGDVFALGDEGSIGALSITSNVKLTARVSAYSGQDYKVRLAAAGAPVPTDPSEKARAYFLMAGKEQASGSFVIALDDEKLIRHARNLLNNSASTSARIFIGRVAETSGGYNRDFTHPSNAPWSWHVAEAIEFADFASQKCDGSPQLIEDVLPGWMKFVENICFWNYSVSRELTFEEVASGEPARN